MINIILNLLYQNKALDIKIFKKKNLYSDYIIIATGTSDKHVNSVIDNIVLNIKNNIILISGKNTNWVIIDMNNITLHVMTNISRSTYKLELLYNNINEN